MAANERVEGPVVTRKNATKTLTCQPELGVGFNCRYNLTEHGRGDDMDLVKKNEAPFTGLQEIHHLLRVMSSRALVRNHRVRGNNDAAFARELQNVHQSTCSRDNGRRWTYSLLLLGGEDAYLSVRYICPLHELLAPLHNRYRRCAKHEARFLDGARCRDAD